jgi:hypothetical protein
VGAVYDVGGGSKDMTVMPPVRHRAAAKKPMWIIVLLCLVSVVLIGAYVYPPHHYSQCYLSASGVCTSFKDWLPSIGRRERTDEEIISAAVIRDILAMPMSVSKNPKIALMFLTPGSLPFEKLWEKFLQVCLISPVVIVQFKDYGSLKISLGFHYCQCIINIFQF